MAGRRKVPKLTDSEIVALYRDGQSVSLIALKSRVPDYHITAVLCAAGIRLRGPAEALRLALQTRRQWPSTQRMRKRLGHASPAAL